CHGGVKPRCKAQAGHDIRLRRCEWPEHGHKNPAFLYRLVPPVYGQSDRGWGPPPEPLVQPIVEKVTDEFQALIDKHGPAKAAAIQAGLTE
ncbi:hypothetical protein LCGC14_2941480, partial [marine sediment metagenome]